MLDNGEGLEQLVAQLIRPEVRRLKAYHVPDSGDMLKADAMENPYFWPQELKQQWLQRLSTIEINRYPDPQAQGVVTRFKKVMSIAPQFDLLLGNGSDEIIQLLALAVARPGATIMAPEPSFVMYRMIALLAGLKYCGVPLAAGFELDLDRFLEAIKEQQPALIFLSQPNNPTGNVFAAQDVEAIIDASPGLVIVDEAYTAFTETDSLYLLEKYPNVLVMRTVSKIGLAGLRLGLLIGRPQWLREIDKLRMPYNINVLTQASAEFALDHYAWLDRQAKQIVTNRQVFYQRLSNIPGLKVWPSETNFLLVQGVRGAGKAIFQQLKQQGILIKCLDGSHPQLADTFRITVGLERDNSRIAEALENLLKY